MLKRYTTDTTLPFRTYRQSTLDGDMGDCADFVPSVTHFYQSERFRGVDDAFRQEILNQPTPREARKLARSRKDRQRSDWTKRRGRIMACGISFQALEHPFVLEALTAKTYCFAGPRGYWVDKDGAGAFPKLLDYLGGKLSKPCSVFVYGFGVPVGEFRFSSHMRLLFSRTRPTDLLLGSGRGLDRTAERWAVERYIPVRRRPQLSRLHRASDTSILEAMQGGTHAVLFGDSKRQDVQRMRQLAIGAGLATRLLSERQPDNHNAGSVVGIDLARKR